MKATEAGFVALRFLGLWFILVGLWGIPSALSFLATGAYSGPETRMLGIGLLVANLAIIVLAAYLFVRSRKVSHWLFSSGDDLELDGPNRSLQAVGFSVIGVYFVIGALPGLGTELVNFVWVLRHGAAVEREAFFTSATLLEVLYNLLSLAAGAFVFARSTWLARLWTDLQGSSEGTA